jgi:FHS family glucose/mannose:H+ symporter-like MFS transporter
LSETTSSITAASRSEARGWITALYFTTFLVLGMSTASMGPTLPGLAGQVQVRLSQVSILFSTRASGYLVGALWSGRLYDRRNGHPIMAAALLGAAVMMALVPVMPSLWMLALVMLLLGGAESFLDVGANTLLVWLHREKVGPFMSALHFFFGLGAFLAPVIIAQVVLLTGRYSWAYWLLALCLLPVSAALLRPPSPTSPHRDSNGRVDAPVHWPLLLLYVLLFLTFVGPEGAYGGWIYSYAVNMQLADAQMAAYLTAAYWGSFTLSRLASIPLAARFSPRTLLIADLVGCLVSMGMLSVWNQSVPVVWLATILFGASIASVFPAAISYVGEKMAITGLVTSMFFVGACLGGILLPLVIGQFFELVGPQAVPWILFFCMIFSVVIFTAITVLQNRRIHPAG